MTKISYVVSMFVVSLATASAVMAGQSVAAEQSKAARAETVQSCVSTIDYNNLTKEQFETLIRNYTG